MNIHKLLYILFLFGWGSWQVQAQVQTDTLPSLVPQTHQYFHVHVPVGELFLRSSSECGLTLTHLKAPDPSVRLNLDEEVDRNGNQHRHLTLSSPSLTPKGNEVAAGSSSNLRITSGFSSLDTYDSPEQYRSEIQLDPNYSTDLFLDLGVGASRLDLSGLSLRTLTVKAAFSDVMIHYNQPNQTEMEAIDIHATRGDVTLKYPEMSQARNMVVHNDMGDTKIILGDTHLTRSSITVRAGMGNCVLIVDQQHPVRILVKAGLFTDEEIASGFIKVRDGVYTNQSFRAHCEAGERGCEHSTTVILDLDLGSLAVMEKK